MWWLMTLACWFASRFPKKTQQPPLFESPPGKWSEWIDFLKLLFCFFRLFLKKKCLRRILQKEKTKKPERTARQTSLHANTNQPSIAIYHTHSSAGQVHKITTTTNIKEKHQHWDKNKHKNTSQPSLLQPPSSRHLLHSTLLSSVCSVVICTYDNFVQNSHKTANKKGYK